MNVAAQLQPKDIHIHLFRFEKNPSFYSTFDFLSLLSSEESYRYSSLKNESRQREFLWSRLLLRSLLSSYLDRETKTIQISYQAKGKPFVENAGLYFNLSHSGDLIACSFARAEVGIDIEKMEETVKVQERCALLAKSYFSSDEQVYLFDQSPESWTSTFFRIFTLKEAYAKALGRGLSLPFDQFTVPLPLKNPSHLESWECFSEIDQAHHVCLAHVVATQIGGNYERKISDWSEESLVQFVREINEESAE